MIDFGRFYQQIAVGPLAKWLEVLPAQISEWQRENLHGHFRDWYKSLEYLPLLEPQSLTCCTALLPTVMTSAIAIVRVLRNYCAT